MKILLFDNYDSFTYNLLHILKELGADVEVHRNDKISLEEIERFDKILLSPGPGIPEEFGATLINLTDVHHGVCSDIRIVAKDPIFEGLEPGIRVGRYHSWAVSKENFPDCLEITAVDTEEGQIMGLRHREYNVRGIQFHPESVLTPKGKTIIENWLKR